MTQQDHNALHVMEVETFGQGGLIHYAYNLSCALAGLGHRVTLVTSVGYELDAGTGAELPDGVDLVKQTARWTQGAGVRNPLVYKLEALFDAASVAWRALRLRPDVVHLHCTNPILLVHLLLLRFLGLLGFSGTTRAVATAHVVTPHESPSLAGLQRVAYRWIHRLPHLVVAHSEFDRQRLLDEFGVRPERVVVIPHGEYGFFERAASEVPASEAARRELGLGPDDEVALFFGYLREYKGLDVLLKAWQAVREQRPNARLVVAGDPVQLSPSRRAELEDEARRLGAVCRFGYVPFADVPGYFAAADVLVMPYRRISQSGVLFLALSLGVPVVATRVGGLPEMLDDGDSALLVPPEDPSTLACALRRVLGDAGLRQQLASGGLRVAADHSWPTIAERTATVLQKLAV